MTCADMHERRHSRDGMIDYVIEALRTLGGIAALPQIYKQIKKDCRKGDKNLPPEWESVIRRTLQAFSSDAKQFLYGRDVFRMAKERGRGWWALRLSLPDSRVGRRQPRVRTAG
jgi:hypothetical protein